MLISMAVTTGEAAKALNVAPATLLRWMHEGIVEPVSTTAGGHQRWDLEDLKRQLAAHQREKSSRSQQ